MHALHILGAWLPAAVLAVNGGDSQKPFTYMSLSGASVPGGLASSPLRRGTFQYTGLGAAESNIDFAKDGSLIYSPAISTAGVGYATSHDNGTSWQQVLPDGSAQPRPQPIFRKRSSDGRYFFWSTSGPGLDFSYSDDAGSTWTKLDGGHFNPEIQDWAKLVGGKPVRSNLTNGAREILYLSAPAFISTPLPVEPVGPEFQHIMKSTDRGNSWRATAGAPTLQPLLSGGACSSLIGNLAGQELIIWGDGLVRPNGTVVYGLRRCQALSLAISDDEGDHWRLVDVPGSHLPPFIVGDLTYLLNGNVLVPEPVSQDSVNGNLNAIWVDSNYVLQFSYSTDNARTWSQPVVIGAPGAGLTPGGNSSGANSMTYLPTLTPHPTQSGRAALAYYGSTDGGKTYNAYVAETKNLYSNAPVWSALIANPPNAPMQANADGVWDQGYGDPLYDLVEFSDVKYRPGGSGGFVAAFARRMCTAPSQPPQTYPASSCTDGWDFAGHAQSEWQGFVAFAS